jgi:23S rRNA (adenine2503-C2)-methyltransferase
MAPHDRFDFRNNSTDTVRRIFLEAGFSEHRIGNFKKAFREQNVSELGRLKGVTLRDAPLDRLPFSPLGLVRRIADGAGNEKFVFETFDGHLIESVVLAGKRAPSVCVSVQVGCRFRCVFCHTGRIGFKRDLYPFEILDQVRQMYQTSIVPRPLFCVSFMGMGEPFDNLDNCRAAFDWIRCDWGWMIGAKKITFSTLGALNWDAFFRISPLPNLAVSLHSARDNVRRALIPGDSTGLDALREKMIRYAEITNKQVSVAYCLFEGVNDSSEDARALAAYLRGVPCKVNLLSYNPLGKAVDGLKHPSAESARGASPLDSASGLRFNPVSPGRVRQFVAWCKEEGVAALHRKSLGVTIGAGCGQLGAAHPAGGPV